MKMAHLYYIRIRKLIVIRACRRERFMPARYPPLEHSPLERVVELQLAESIAERYPKSG